ncbi:MAG: hypothetical protein ABSG42_07590 [Nitrospirota bacterium]
MEEHSEENKRTKEEKKDDVNSFIGVTAEYLFLIIPFVVLSVVMAYKNNAFELIYSPEWALSSAILFGQTIVKLVSGISAYKGGLYWQRVAIIFSLIIVFGLIPSLIVLTLILTSSRQVFGLAVSQIILFILSSLALLSLGGLGQLVLDCGLKGRKL